MITYNWNCRTVDCYPEQDSETDVVYNVHWVVTGVSDQVDPEGNPYSAANIGTQTLDTSEITNFIPFEDLTNDEVVAWTKSAMGVDKVNNIEASIQTQINSLITPISITLTIGEPVPPVE
jgi:hypothetical protein|tara:strand:- start:131 stop:490 length:360 start_codon:yes stop_codon:yes gene_type:complete